MDAPAVKRMTVPEFLAWAETQESGRYELIRGEIVAMAPERSAHVQAKRRAANALEAAIKRAGIACEAFVDGLAVHMLFLSRGVTKRAKQALVQRYLERNLAVPRAGGSGRRNGG